MKPINHVVWNKGIFVFPQMRKKKLEEGKCDFFDALFKFGYDVPNITRSELY